MAQAEAKNMKLIAQDTLVGFGGMGEGMSMQVAGDGRRIMWVAHESAPKNFTGVDVTDIKKSQGHRADRVAPHGHALELARGHRRCHGRGLPDQG